MEQALLHSPPPAVYLGHVHGRLRFECKTSPIHGEGLFTIDAVKKNDSLFRESPACYHTKLYERFSEASISKAIAHLSQSELEAFQALHHSLGKLYKDGTLSKFLSNAFDFPAPKGYVTKGLFLTAAKLNHSPTPNARIYWDDGTDAMILEALQRATKNTHVPSLEFECNCKKCASVNEGKGANRKQGDAEKGASLCNVCSFEEARNTPSTIKNDEDGQMYDKPAKILTDERMALNVEGARLHQAAASNNSGSWPISTQPIGPDGNAKLPTGIHTNPGGASTSKGKELSGQDSDYEDEFLDEGSDDNDDLENLDVRPGVHSWLEKGLGMWELHQAQGRGPRFPKKLKSIM